MVDTCVEYLNQPLAKKEEGIFRVSGDSSIIKSLHSQFMTHDQDTEQVMCVVCICDRILENNKCWTNMHNYRVLAKEWKSGAALLYTMPFPFDVVKGMQLNHRYALIFVSALVC